MSDEHLAMVAELRRFVADRDWQQFHDPKNLSMLIGSEAGELMAEYRWVSNTNADDYSQQPEARGRIADEIADVGIGLLMLCDRIGLDLWAAMKQKLEKNMTKYPADRVRGRADEPRDA